ncbi:MAG: heme exporter protein CcmD [Hylemonella sp.]|nr:heme exporter protein CcmD [Hylemonella sp.]
MNWNSFDDFMAMGGYGLYVWGSYALVLLLMLLEPVLVERRHHRALDQTRDNTGER